MWNKAQGDSQDHSAGRVALAWSDLPDRPCFVSDPPLPLTPASFGLFSLYRHPWMVLSAAVPNAALSSFLVFVFFFFNVDHFQSIASVLVILAMRHVGS